MMVPRLVDCNLDESEKILNQPSVKVLIFLLSIIFIILIFFFNSVIEVGFLEAICFLLVELIANHMGSKFLFLFFG